ncbi:5100_t:CDS:1, partial [Dentiscutata heterogama]
AMTGKAAIYLVPTVLRLGKNGATVAHGSTVVEISDLATKHALKITTAVLGSKKTFGIIALTITAVVSISSCEYFIYVHEK